MDIDFVKLAWAVIMPVLVLATGLLFLGIARKYTARINKRVGPPVYQQFIDLMKLFSKKSNITHSWVFDLGALFAVVGILTALLFVPIGGLTLYSFDGDLIVLMYLLVIAPLGMALAAGASGNPNANIGVSRGLTLMMGYELPFVIVLVTLMLYHNTTSLAELVEKQNSLANWNLMLFPVSALIADIALQGMLGEKPFDQPIAPHEIASGPMVEFGGKYLGMLMIWHAVAIIVELTLFIDLFFGGATNLLTWFIKILAVFIFALTINAVFPRFRIERAFGFYWKWPTIIAFLGLIYALYTGVW